MKLKNSNERPRGSERSDASKRFASINVSVCNMVYTHNAAPDQNRLRLIAISSWNNGLPSNRPPAWRPERAEYITARRGLDIARART